MAAVACLGDVQQQQQDDGMRRLAVGIKEMTSYWGQASAPINAFNERGREYLNDSKLWRELWAAWEGDNFEQSELMLRSLTQKGAELLNLFPSMSYDEAAAKYNWRRHGEVIISDSWEFGTGPLAIKGKRTPGMLNRSVRRTRTQGMQHFGNGFEVPLDWMGNPRERERYAVFVKQVEENIRQTWSFQVVETLLRESRGYQNRRIKQSMVVQDLYRIQERLHYNWDLMGALQKNGKGFVGMEDQVYQDCLSRNVHLDTVLTTAGTAHFLYARRHFSYAEHGESVYPEKRRKLLETEGAAHTSLHNLRVIESRRFPSPDLPEPVDPLVENAYISQRFEMLYDASLGELGDYQSRHRGIAVVDADLFQNTEISLMDAFKACGLFSEAEFEMAFNEPAAENGVPRIPEVTQLFESRAGLPGSPSSSSSSAAPPPSSHRVASHAKRSTLKDRILLGVKNKGSNSSSVERPNVFRMALLRALYPGLRAWSNDEDAPTFFELFGATKIGASNVVKFAGEGSFRAEMLMLPITNINGWLWLIENNIPFPMSFLLFRMHMRVDVGSVIFFKRGEQTGVHCLKDCGVSFSRDVATFSLGVSVRLTSNTIIVRPDNLELVPHVFFKRYRSGGGVQLYRPHEDKTAYTTMHLNHEKDIFVVAVPPTFKPRFSYTDITGALHKAIQVNTAIDAHYPTHSVYANHWGWKPNPRALYSSRSQIDGGYDLSVCARSSYKRFNGATSNHDILVPGVCPMGPSADAHNWRIALGGGMLGFSGSGFEGSRPSPTVYAMQR
jgi:hypothetical protein